MKTKVSTLSPWLDILSSLPTPTKEFMSDLLPRLSNAIGTLRGHAQQTYLGEPDGYNGVSHQGKYERLLLTEWALAQHHPMEFLRRAIMHEQLYLKSAYIEPQGNRSTIVLFDVGPEQLGSLRVTHLGILLVLKYRIEQVGGTLYWGLLQHPNLGLWDVFDYAASLNLFNNRSTVIPSDIHKDAWKKLLTTEGVLNDSSHSSHQTSHHTHDIDYWVVGSEQAWMPAWQRITIEDPCQPGPPTAHIHVQSSHHTRTLDVVLPPDSISHLLLLTPLARIHTKDAVVYPVHNDGPTCDGMFFNHNGSKLFVLTHQILRIYSMPLYRRTRLKKPYEYYYMDKHIIAYGRRKKKLVVLIDKGESLYLDHPIILNKSIPKDQRFASPDLSQTAMPTFTIHTGFLLLVRDRLKALWLLDFKSSYMQLVEIEASLPIVSDNYIAYLKKSQAGRSIEIRCTQLGAQGILGNKYTSIDIINGPMEWKNGVKWREYFVLTVAAQSNQWYIYMLSIINREILSMGFIDVPPEYEVIGARVLAKEGQHPSDIYVLSQENCTLLKTELFVLSPSYTDLLVYTDDSHRLLQRFDIPVIRAALSCAQNYVVLWFGNQTMQIIDLDTGEMMLENVIDLEDT